MNKASRKAAALVICACLPAWSCSWVLMKPLPQDAPASEKPDCGTNGLEKTDGMFAGIFAGASALAFGSYALAISSEKKPWLPPEVNLATGVGYAVPMLIFAASAITGHFWAKRCDGQALSHRDWLAARGKDPASAPVAETPAAPAVEAAPVHLEDDRPCPQGAHAHGAPPPYSFVHGCALPSTGDKPIWHGPHTTWYKNGIRSSDGEYANGKRHGKWIYWYDDGKKKLESHYHQGAQVGHWIYWNRQGEVFNQVEFPPAPEE